MGLSNWHNKFFIFPYVSINVEEGNSEIELEIGWLKWSVDIKLRR
jgi:hypothetical protein